MATPQSMLKHIEKNGLDEGIDVACVMLAINVNEIGIPHVFFLQPRLFRNLPHLRYKSRVHNYLTGFDQKAAQLSMPDLVIVHNMPPEREAKRAKQRKQMNIAGLFKDHKENPTNPRPIFYLGNTHADLGNHSKAMYWYEKYLKNPGFQSERYQVYQQLAVLNHQKGKTEKAKDMLIKAMQIDWTRKEPYLILGEMAFEVKDWDQVIHWYTVADEMPAPTSIMFSQGPTNTFLPDLKRMEAYEQKSDWMKALHYANRVCEHWGLRTQEIENKIRVFKDRMRPTNKDKHNILIVDRLGSFTGDIAKHLDGKGYPVATRQECDEQWATWSDLMWFEWCDNNIVQWSQRRMSRPVICRLHSYEAFSDLPSQVNWNNVDHLVFVADHIRALFADRWPDALPHTSTIPNGVDVAKFAYKERKHGTTIGFLGYLNSKKGIDLLCQAIYGLPEYHFRIAGKFQDMHLMYYFEHVSNQVHNVQFDGWVEDKEEWLNKVDYLISPSIVESFGYSIAEAMCKGIKPLIHDRQGAIWPDTWRTIDDLKRMLEEPYESERYREHIKENFSLDKQLQSTEALIEAMIAKGV